jgi:hypothetical protein
MKTLGIDLSSMPAGTSASLITWAPGRAVAAAPVRGCQDSTLDELISQADIIGIDAPFGWPMDFVNAVSGGGSEEWNVAIRDRLRLRETDRWVHHGIHHQPLSVSSDRIALPAMRAMALLKRHGVADRSGDGRFFEVYPAGSLAVWGLPARGYKKKNDAKDFALRIKMLQTLCDKMPWLDASDEYAKNADDLDSLVASLTARAAAQGLTHRPAPDVNAVAMQEGWIHLPKQWPTL